MAKCLTACSFTVIYNMKLNWLALVAYIFIFFAASCRLTAGDVADDESYALRFREAYAIADPLVKRELVIKAIDERAIRTGRMLDEIMKLFPENVDKTELFQHEDGRCSLLVFFKPVLLPPRPLMSSIRNGWYIHFKFSPGKVLIEYNLSNVHKGISG